MDAFLSPSPVVNMILTLDRRKVVLIRRNLSPYYGLWAFPGGYVDHGEDWRAAALRETKEELGIDLEALGCPTRLVGGPVSTSSNYLMLFVHADLPAKMCLDDIPAYRNPLDVSDGEVSEVCLRAPNAAPFPRKLGVPGHQKIWSSLVLDPAVGFQSTPMTW